MFKLAAWRAQAIIAGAAVRRRAPAPDLPLVPARCRVNVIDFPVPPEADIDDAELARILSQTCGSLVLANGRLDAEKANLQGCSTT
jgi:hypothetical protein